MLKKIILPLIFSCSVMHAEVMNWTSQNNFLNAIYKTNNVEVFSADGIPLYYKIKKSSALDGDGTDLYLSFDRDHQTDIDQAYRVIYSQFQYKDKNAYINTSGFFYKNNQRIELEGNADSFFVPGRILGSFSISMWVYPLNFSTNETLFKIGSHYYNESSDAVEDQSITGELSEGIFTCRFNNVFYRQNGIAVPLREVAGYNRISSNEWTNITLTYDAYQGLIKVLINGRENGIIMVSEDGTPDSSFFNLRFNQKNRCIISIAPDFTGALDEFLIKKGVMTDVKAQYDDGGGEVVSKVIKLDDNPVVLKSVNFDENVNTEIESVRYYIRISQDSFYQDDTAEVTKKVSWLPFNDEVIRNVKAQYIQWKAVLLPGASGKVSPEFKGIRLNYEQDLPPAKPQGIRVLSAGGTLKIKWILNSERDVKGYKIYYGTRPGEYFGTEALQGASPVKLGKAGEFTLTNLKRNAIYYIAITAYDDDQGIHESEFSDEVYVRFDE